ncbi:MAG: O-methyltransferase [Muribaculaceae bacterium]|nr:O-methyltransferase [Muribaculaceae bacterium]
MTLDDYILTRSDPEPPHLARLSHDVGVKLLYPRMCSGHLQGRILTMLTSMISPRNALEIGTYAGYSALCIAEGLPAGGHLDTIEIDDEMEDFIRARFADSPYGDRITLHIGDAADILPGLGKRYDMAYMDANKRTYCETFRTLLPMINPGGFILADNTLWDGKVTDPEAHHDPQTRGICEFNDMIAADPRLTRVILPLRDGLTLIRVNP